MCCDYMHEIKSHEYNFFKVLHCFKSNFSAEVASKNTLYVLMNSNCCLLAIVAKSDLLWDRYSSNPHKHCRCHDGGRHRSVPLVYSLKTVSLRSFCISSHFKFMTEMICEWVSCLLCNESAHFL